MAKFNYYLRSGSAKQSTITLFIHFKGSRIKIATGESIETKYWDLKKQRAKPSYDGADNLNAFLNSFIQKAEDKIRDFKNNDTIPTNQELRKAVEIEEKKEGSEVITVFSKFIDATALIREKNTLKKYTSTLNHLTEFQKAKKDYYTFESLNQNFHDEFVTYLHTKVRHGKDKDTEEKKVGLNNNSVTKYIKVVKTFLQWAFEREYHTNLTFKRFKTREFAAEIVYLKEKELFKIYKLDLNKIPTLNKVRDAFCFAAFTGQRFSDVYNLTWDDIKGEKWILHTKKTKDTIEIPLNKFALAILKKYKGKGKPLYAFSNQKMNYYLKQICEKAEIQEKVKSVSFIGSERKEKICLKSEMVTTHTARRTFVTLSLEKGMRPETVMAITGHKDYKTFKKYIKISSQVATDEMKQIWK